MGGVKSSLLVALCATTLACVALAGCSAAPEAFAPTPGASAVATPGPDARSLRELGLRNGPEAFWLPREVTVRERIDQPNVVTLSFDASEGPALARYLSEHLAEMGWDVTADRNGSLLFTTDDWRGAFTTPTAGESAGLAALTLRRT